MGYTKTHEEVRLKEEVEQFNLFQIQALQNKVKELEKIIKELKK
jgi:hypothetical protein|tara:strand:+ start:72 stop:203 length:132 start_codon:yes stop_codon:yes gene_type:complete